MSIALVKNLREERFREAALEFSAHVPTYSRALEQQSFELFFHGYDLTREIREQKMAEMRQMMATLINQFSVLERAHSNPSEADVIARLVAVAEKR